MDLDAAGRAPDPREDRDLVRDHVAGDPDAFSVLIRRHQDRLWAVALRTTGDPEEAADALQEALVKAFRSAAGYRAEAAVTTWLHRIVVNASLDRLRRRAVRRTEPLPQHEQPEDPRDLVEPGPAELNERHERRDRVVAALREIPADQRAALVLVDMEGYSVAEAAQVLGVPSGTVKSRCARGRARLAGLLGDLRESATTPDPAEPGNRPGAGRVTPQDDQQRPDEGRTVP